jgi:ABC-type nitrate/sulfonate/bicarbonate transport system substrate-binding protein
VQARLTLEKAGATATFVGLGTYENIYKALVKGEIDAGTLPVHLRLSGEREHGWIIFEMAGFKEDVPSVLATTRKFIAANRDVVMRVVKGHVETIHAFKTQPDVFIPLLQRFLKVDNRQLAADMHKHYTPLFPQVPRIAGAGLQPARNAFAKKYPVAQRLQEADFVDSSFIDELDNSGFIRTFYAGAQ